MTFSPRHQRTMSDASDIKSSLPLQVALHFNKPFAVFFFVVAFIETVYKGTRALALCVPVGAPWR